NVRPDVPYVGDDACARCHRGHAASFREHPMGRSVAPAARAAPVERYGPSAHNPFDKGDLQYLVERGDGRVVHRERRRDAQGRVVTELAAEVQLAVGSGTRGRTYLVNRDGYLFQSPVSWYTQHGRWDLTPGLDPAEHFDRPARADCLFCH